MALLRAPKMTARDDISNADRHRRERSAWLARERFSFNCARIEAMLIDDHAGRDLPLVRVRLVPSNAETVRPGATALEPLTAKRSALLRSGSYNKWEGRSEPARSAGTSGVQRVGHLARRGRYWASRSITTMARSPSGNPLCSARQRPRTSSSTSTRSTAAPLTPRRPAGRTRPLRPGSVVELGSISRTLRVVLPAEVQVNVTDAAVTTLLGTLREWRGGSKSRAVASKSLRRAPAALRRLLRLLLLRPRRPWWTRQRRRPRRCTSARRLACCTIARA